MRHHAVPGDTGAAWPPPGAAPVLAAMGAWLAGALLVGASGWLSGLRPPAPQLILAGLTVALLVVERCWAPLRGFVGAVDLRALALFHLTRFVGFYFLALHARRELPWAFAVPGGWGDNHHYAARFDVRHARDQVYLRPHPKGLMLRNHA